eukprot:TRINITY_DN1549_c0_g1_i1.p1 TRINITY_DN1549_c0_g1~~TRINITY_DN1549_c0_g1_i1.p1  ORF type:complete len:690 (+),score=195.31 TRINITY_DN1549_c0_g1_i1:59-2128(+)
MSYADAVKDLTTTGGPQLSPAQKRSKKRSKQNKQNKAESVVAKVDTFEGNNGGYFSILDVKGDSIIDHIITLLDAAGLSNLITTCHSLFGFSQKRRVKQILKTVPFRYNGIGIKIALELGVQVEAEEEEESEEESTEDAGTIGIVTLERPKVFDVTKFEKNLLNIEFFDNQRNLNNLAKYLYNVVVYNTSKQEKTLDFGGEVSYSNRVNRKNVKKGGRNFNFHKIPVVTTGVRSIHNLLQATIDLLEGAKEVTLVNGNQTLYFTRVGIGGKYVQLTAEYLTEPDEEEILEPQYFSLDNFAMQIRDDLKSFKRVALKLQQYWKNGRITKGQDKDYIKGLRNTATSIVDYQFLKDGLKTVKILLVNGAVPHSNIAQRFKERSAKKTKIQKQQNIEYKGMFDDLNDTLPTDWQDEFDEAKQQLKAKSDERRRQREVIAEREREAASALLSNIAATDAVKTQKRKKQKPKKITDNDGFITYSDQNEEFGDYEPQKTADTTTNDDKNQSKGATFSTNNPFAMINQSGSVTSINLAQQKRKQGKKKGNGPKPKNVPVVSAPKNNNAKKTTKKQQPKNAKKATNNNKAVKQGVQGRKKKQQNNTKKVVSVEPVEPVKRKKKNKKNNRDHNKERERRIKERIEAQKINKLDKKVVGKIKARQAKGQKEFWEDENFQLAVVGIIFILGLSILYSSFIQ